MGLKEYLQDFGSSELDFPKIAGTYTGNVVVCADAACIWDDLERFGCRSERNLGIVEKSGWHIMTVNKVVEVLPGTVEHCYSNSPSCLKRFVAARRDEYADKPRHLHAISPGVEHVWNFGGHGTSGLGAALVAVALGYIRIVLCGMPLDDGPHNGEPPWRRTGFASSEAAGGVRTGRNTHWWKARELAFDGKVRSMSGRTKTWLGDAMEWA